MNRAFVALVFATLAACDPPPLAPLRDSGPPPLDTRLVGTWFAQLSTTPPVHTQRFSFDAAGTFVQSQTLVIPATASAHPGCTLTLTSVGDWSNIVNAFDLHYAGSGTETFTACPDASDDGPGPPYAEPGVQEYSYHLDGDVLTIIDSTGVPVAYMRM